MRIMNVDRNVTENEYIYIPINPGKILSKQPLSLWHHKESILLYEKT